MHFLHFSPSMSHKQTIPIYTPMQLVALMAVRLVIAKPNVILLVGQGLKVSMVLY